jgi:CSLREA domain-containing protein
VAATLTVSTTADEFQSGDSLCSLREAVSAVNSPGTPGDCGTASVGANTIQLAAKTYTLTREVGLIVGPPPTGCLGGGSQHTDDNTRGDLTVLGSVHDLTIAGAGTGATAIDACKLGDRALNIQAGATVTVRDLTITDGHAPGGTRGNDGTSTGQNGMTGGTGEYGGAIFNAGTLTLTDVTVTASHAGSGAFGGGGGPGDAGTAGAGGAGGAGGWGGGIFNTVSGNLTLTGSTVSGNTAGGGGAGGTAGISATGNGGAGGSGGTGGYGGGIESVGSLTISTSTINGNDAGTGGDGVAGANSTANGGAGGNGGGAGFGGGISADEGTMTVTNSTITGNVSGTGGHSAVGGSDGGGAILQDGAGGNGGGGGDGGGISAANLASSSLLNMTLASNSLGSAQAGSNGGGGNFDDNAGTAGAAAVGGGVFATGAAPVTLQNTIVASNGNSDNCATTSTSIPIATEITNGGHNIAYAPPSLHGLNAPGACGSGFLTGDPLLGTLQNNLGPTFTMALGTGSPAIDQIPPSGSGCLTTDQRGLPRPSGTACDIGAYEVTPPTVTATAATGVSTSSATIHGTVVADAVTATAHFDTTDPSATQTQQQTVAGTQTTQLSSKLTGLKPSTTYHYSVVATSADGTSTSTQVNFTTQALPPVITSLKVKPVKFVASSKHGAKISYTDSAASRTTFVVYLIKHGKKKKWIGSFTRNDRAGKNSFHFNGRVGKHFLKPGRYRLMATPRASGGTGAARSAGFKVKRP